MEAWTYEVVSIDGDYANLRRTDVANIGACDLEQSPRTKIRDKSKC